LERDVKRIQQQLEDDAMKSGDSGRVSLADGERLLKIVRSTSFTALLEDGVASVPVRSAEERGTAARRAVPVTTEGAPRDVGSATTSRRVFLDDD
jgi:hypothetical protein